MITDRIICGDAIIELPTLPENSVDSIVTDPPAGISFMSKKWDDDKGGRDNWIKWLSAVMTGASRVLKPGGHALVWALPRTSHWTGFALENAGFEVRDIVHHLFGSGFPKSMDVSKAIDKQAGAEREVIATIKKKPSASADCNESWVRPWAEGKTTMDITAPATPEAKKWSGWGTALKPAVECWWLVRKPISEKTVAQNVLKWGTGALNIDGCRVDARDKAKFPEGIISKTENNFGNGKGLYEDRPRPGDKYPQGRFPANLIHDGSNEVLAEFAKAGVSKSIIAPRGGTSPNPMSWGEERKDGAKVAGHSDSGTPARFFKQCPPDNYCSLCNVVYTKETERTEQSRFLYTPKPSKAERDAGLQRIKTISAGNRPESPDPTGKFPDHDHRVRGGNNHPTVKAQALMQYLIKLITPPRGIVLDPFAGSGSTLVAARKLGHPYIGIEIDPGYCEIAEKRLIADLNGNCSLDAFDDIGGK